MDSKIDKTTKMLVTAGLSEQTEMEEQKCNQSGIKTKKERFFPLLDLSKRMVPLARSNPAVATFLRIPLHTRGESFGNAKVA